MEISDILAVLGFIAVAVLVVFLIGYLYKRKKKFDYRHIDGVPVTTYEQLKGCELVDASEAPSSTAARDVSNKENAPPPHNWLACCSRRPQRTGRLMRKPAAQKLQRSTGASRSEPRVIDFSQADSKKWTFPETPFDGRSSYYSKPVKEEVNGLIEEGLEKLKKDPATYEGIIYQSDMKGWPVDQQKYTMLKRTGSGYSVKEAKGGAFTYVSAKYSALKSDIKVQEDAHTDKTLAKYEAGQCGTPVAPGRGKGCGDVPGLKIIGDVDPSDVNQGHIGDCWLLSAISAMAEYDGTIEKMFKKTQNLKAMPADEPNTYTVTVYDLPSGKPVDIVVDERLCTDNDNKLLASKPSVDGELWVCYIEKAVAAHCGGWDKIDGGTCTHGWHLLTGCKHQYTIRDDGKGFCCYGKKNPNTGQWEELGNSPSEGFQGLWPSEWPEAGGGGGMDQKIDADDLFERMCAWHDQNYLMGCGSKAGSDAQDTDGIVDGHAYTILDCINDAGGKQEDGNTFDMIKVRNPWGKGEFQSGRFDDDGPGWDQYPQVKAACKPVQADDGVFWLEKSEFFKHFHTIYLCGLDMEKFLNDEHLVDV